MRPLVALVLLALVACGESQPTPSDPAALPKEIGGERPASVRYPRELVEGRRYPLVILLHGYGATGAAQDLYLGLSSLTTEYDFILVIPDGTLEDLTHGGTVEPAPGVTPKRFWNATNACCNFHGADVDDVAYLTGLIDEAIDELPIDADRVYLFGHSNGGYMSYRMACDATSRLAGIASLAGATYKDPSRCDPDGLVSVLQIHGSLDDTVPYEGSEFIPSARESVEFWAERAGCDVASPVAGETLDLEDNLPGAETEVLHFEGCDEPGYAFSLYTIVDGSHLPISTKSKNLSRRTLDWLFARRRGGATP